MTTEQFWQSIDAACAVYDDLDDRIRAIAAHLEDASDADLAEFRDTLAGTLARLMTGEIYGAGVLLTGRTFSAERFEELRCAFVLKGRWFCEEILQNPDNIAEYDFTQQEKELDFASDMLLFAPQFVFQSRHGEEADLDAAYPPVEIVAADVNGSFDKDALQQTFPRFWPKRRAMIQPKVTAD